MWNWGIIIAVCPKDRASTNVSIVLNICSNRTHLNRWDLHLHGTRKVSSEEQGCSSEARKAGTRSHSTGVTEGAGVEATGGNRHKPAAVNISCKDKLLGKWENFDTVLAGFSILLQLKTEIHKKFSWKKCYIQ